MNHSLNWLAVTHNSVTHSISKPIQFIQILYSPGHFSRKVVSIVGQGLDYRTVGFSPALFNSFVWFEWTDSCWRMQATNGKATVFYIKRYTPEGWWFDDSKKFIVNPYLIDKYSDVMSTLHELTVDEFSFYHHLFYYSYESCEKFRPFFFLWERFCGNDCVYNVLPNLSLLFRLWSPACHCDSCSLLLLFTFIGIHHLHHHFVVVLGGLLLL